MAQISLTFPDGNARSYDAGVTPADVAADISSSLRKKAISATVDGQHWDLQWPIDADASIALHTMKDEGQALELVRHDLAHIMARAVQEIWPDVQVTIGPVIKDGWYYDFDRKEAFVPEDLALIEKKMKEIINKRDDVRTEMWSRADAIAYYEQRGEPYKVELIAAIPGDEPLRMYWHGDWQDLCRGPHLQNTGQVPADAFKLMSIAGAYWRGDSDRAMLQRIYGCAFTNKEGLKAHMHMLEEAAKRDHRKLGREMDLFHMQEEAPGQVFWHPNGWTIYTELQDYIRRRQRAGGYVEVNTPQVVNRQLWEKSGHWEAYQDNMFIVEVDEDHAREKTINALKPMNCPCHVQVFNQGLKSYRDLPLRLAEFGSCHRNEMSGALHGIMRVRGFTQDDGHIFCTEEQIQPEVAKFIDFLHMVYRDFGFEEVIYRLSTRPPNRVGSDESWDKSEKALADALDAKGLDWQELPGEGAFYGPKVEFSLKDCIGRVWQCGTVQVDFSMPGRLDASYVAESGEKLAPVMLHRATIGSFERFIGILIENYEGKLPLWLSPVQVVVMNITDNQSDFVEKAVKVLQNSGLRVEADLRNEKIGFKIRSWTLERVPYLLVAGDREVESGQLAVRTRNGKDLGTMSLDTLVEQLNREAASRGQTVLEG